MNDALRHALRATDAAVWKTVRLPLVRVRGGRRIALASYPRSGNTWLRSLVEQATGLRTGSIYDDKVMPRGRSGVVIKTHALDSYRYTHAVYVVRNPFDAIASYFAWNRDVADRTDVEWNAFVPRGIDGWRRHTEHWLAAAGPVHRLRFEDLRRRPLETMRPLLEFIGRPLPDAAIEAAIEASQLATMREKNPHLGKKFFREGSIHGGLAAFTDEQKRLVAETLRDLMRRLDYEDPSG